MLSYFVARACPERRCSTGAPLFVTYLIGLLGASVGYQRIYGIQGLAEVFGPRGIRRGELTCIARLLGGLMRGSPLERLLACALPVSRGFVEREWSVGWRSRA